MQFLQRLSSRGGVVVADLGYADHGHPTACQRAKLASGDRRGHEVGGPGQPVDVRVEASVAPAALELEAALLERETIDAEEVRLLIEGKELPPMRSILASPSDTGGGSGQQVLKPETRGGSGFPEGSPSPA